jgi:hypothetical protein
MLQSCCARLTLEITLTCRAGFDQTVTNVSYSSRLSILVFSENGSKGLGSWHNGILYAFVKPSKKERKKETIKSESLLD